MRNKDVMRFILNYGDDSQEEKVGQEKVEGEENSWRRIIYKNLWLLAAVDSQITVVIGFVEPCTLHNNNAVYSA